MDSRIQRLFLTIMLFMVIFGIIVMVVGAVAYVRAG